MYVSINGKIYIYMFTKKKDTSNCTPKTSKVLQGHTFLSFHHRQVGTQKPIVGKAFLKLC